jgi:hypothetical protein
MAVRVRWITLRLTLCGPKNHKIITDKFRVGFFAILYSYYKHILNYVKIANICP